MAWAHVVKAFRGWLSIEQEMNKLAEIWEEMLVWMMADDVVAWIWAAEELP